MCYEVPAKTRERAPFFNVGIPLGSFFSWITSVRNRGGLASRATGLGPEGPPSARVPMGPFCAGRKIFQMVNFG